MRCRTGQVRRVKPCAAAPGEQSKQKHPRGSTRAAADELVTRQVPARRRLSTGAPLSASNSQSLPQTEDLAAAPIRPILETKSPQTLAVPLASACPGSKSHDSDTHKQTCALLPGNLPTSCFKLPGAEVSRLLADKENLLLGAQLPRFNVIEVSQMRFQMLRRSLSNLHKIESVPAAESIGVGVGWEAE